MVSGLGHTALAILQVGREVQHSPYGEWVESTAHTICRAGGDVGAVSCFLHKISTESRFGRNERHFDRDSKEKKVGSPYGDLGASFFDL